MKKTLVLLMGVLCMLINSSGQFEESQLTGREFEKVSAHLGADFTMQYQILNHHADSTLIPLGSGFNLPTANLNVNADLAKGIRVNMTTYLSSRHHPEAWVKGGYLLIDELPFIKSKGVDSVMDFLTLKVGDMEIDYGDAHYRRSDNGKAITNSFVGNYILDAFTTAIAAELMFRSKGFLAMGAISSGSLKPALSGFNTTSGEYTEYNTLEELAFYWKLGFDKELADDLRLRLTVSGYHCAEHHFGSLYNGDRAGSRYYLVMNRITSSANDVDITKNQTSGNWGPGFTNKDNSFMVNLFGKFKGLELFGTYELLKGTNLAAADVEFSQYAVESLYRFGKREQFYGGLRYNYVQNDADQSVTRLQIGAGWFILESLVLKLEYIDQNYSEFVASYGPDAGFDGVVLEAAISF